MFTSGASHMCMVHNSIFRGYNSIYHQAAHITDADKASFIGYCLTWHKFLKSHADNEEAGLFRGLKSSWKIILSSQSRTKNMVR